MLCAAHDGRESLNPASIPGTMGVRLEYTVHGKSYCSFVYIVVLFFFAQHQSALLLLLLAFIFALQYSAHSALSSVQRRFSVVRLSVVFFFGLRVMLHCLY